jgi:AcrR family transcriptional regulator
MSIGNLYHWVSSKQDILYLIIDHGCSQQALSIERLHDQLSNVSPREAIKESIRAFFEGMDDIQDLVVFMYQETKNVDRNNRERIFNSERRVVAAFENLLQRGIESGDFRAHNTRLVAQTIVAGGHMWAIRRWLLRKDTTLDDYIKFHSESIQKLILNDKLPV